MFRRLVVLVLCLAMLPSWSCVFYRWGRYEIPVDEDLTSQPRTVLAATTKTGEAYEFEDFSGEIRGEHVVGKVGGEWRAIRLDSIERLWVHGRTVDGLTSTAATIGAVVGFFVIGGAIVVVVAIATKSSCPFVYSWNGSEFVFDAEPYGGAITRGLERDDYAELQHAVADDGRYRLRVTNEVPETQCTNLMELLVVEHDPAVAVAPDQQGRFHTLGDRRAPLSVKNEAGRELRRWLAATDRLIWEPLPVDRDAPERQELVMTFEKPPGATRAKLVAHAATGQLGAPVIGQFLALHGRQLESFYASLDSMPLARAAMYSWVQREGLYRLEIEIEEPSGWEVRGILEGQGPLISEHRVVPLDVSRVAGDRLNVRVRPAVGFWALNSFAVDYSADLPVTVRAIAAAAAEDARRGDVRADIRAADERYWRMPLVGDSAELTFPAPAAVPGRARTVFLHSRGYYRLHIAPTDAAPDRDRLRDITTRPGGAVRFAADLFAELQAAPAGR